MFALSPAARCDGRCKTRRIRVGEVGPLAAACVAQSPFADKCRAIAGFLRPLPCHVDYNGFRWKFSGAESNEP